MTTFEDFVKPPAEELKQIAQPDLRFQALTDAVEFAESNGGDPKFLFNKTTGATGPMQVTAIAAKDVGGDYDRAIEDHAYARGLGVKYLRKMYDMFEQEPSITAAAYNTGPTQISKWIRQAKDEGVDPADFIRDKLGPQGKAHNEKVLTKFNELYKPGFKKEDVTTEEQPVRDLYANPLEGLPIRNPELIPRPKPKLGFNDFVQRPDSSKDRPPGFDKETFIATFKNTVQGLKDIGGTGAVIADMVLGFPAFVASETFGLGAAGGAALSGTDRKTAWQAGRAGTEWLLPEWTKSPFGSLLNQIGSGEVYSQSTGGKVMEGFSTKLKEAADWVEKKTNGSVPAEAVETFINQAMIGAGPIASRTVKALRGDIGSERQNTAFEDFIPGEKTRAAGRGEMGERFTDTAGAQDLERSFGKWRTPEEAARLQRRAYMLTAGVGAPVAGAAAGYVYQKLMSPGNDTIYDEPKREPTPTGDGTFLADTDPDFMKLVPLLAMAGWIKAPGGMWHPEAVKRLSSPLKDKLVSGVEATKDAEWAAKAGDTQELKQAAWLETASGKLDAWSDKAIRNYLNKYAGTERDPLKDVEIPFNQDTRRWEEITDAIFRGTPAKEFNKFTAMQNERFDGFGVYDAFDHQHGETYKTLAEAQEAARDLNSYAREKGPEWFDKIPGDERIYHMEHAHKTSREALTNYLSHVGDYLRQNVVQKLSPERWYDRQPQKVKDKFGDRPVGDNELVVNIPEDRITADFNRSMKIKESPEYQAYLKENPLQQYDLVRAVRETAANDARVAKEMEKAAAASMKDMPVYKEYPDGMRWVELKLPEKLTEEQTKLIKGGKRSERTRDTDPLQPWEEYIAHDATGKPIQNTYTGQQASGRTPEEAHLAGQLAQEGNQMGHCVGGYCEGVAAGESRIFSLRDAKGRSHVTIEVAPDRLSEVGKAKQARGEKVELLPDDILQIKGKQNRAPVAEYLPYVQDFVKSGNWGEVGDLGNTGLHRLGNNYVTLKEVLPAAIAAAQRKLQRVREFTPEYSEYSQIKHQLAKLQRYENQDKVEDPAAIYWAETLDTFKPEEVGKPKAAYLPAEIVKKGELAASKKGLIDILGASMYSSGIANTAVKELFQNAFDAVKAAQYTGQINRGKIDIDVDHQKRTVSVQENGIGMTPDTVQKAFFTIAGTDKGDLPPHLRSGGFGLAKMAFILGSESISLRTVRDGKVTTVDATSADIRDDNFSIKTRDTNEPNGTTVKVKIPKGYKDVRTGEDREIYMPYGPEAIPAIQGPLLGNVDVTWNGKKLDIGASQNLKDTPLYTKAKFSWGKADIYIGETRTESPKHTILSSGIYQFRHSFKLKGWEDIPYNIVIDIKPDVTAHEPDYPFNNSRESFKPQLQEDVDALGAYLKKVALGQEASNIKQSFKAFKSMPRLATDAKVNKADQISLGENKELSPAEQAALDKLRDLMRNINISGGEVRASDGSVLAQSERMIRRSFNPDKAAPDTSKFMVDMTGADPNNPIFHNNTNIDWVERFPGSDVLFSKLGTIFVDLVNIAKKYIYPLQDANTYAGISIDKSYRGVRIKVPYEGFFINPLATRSSTVLGATEGILHAMLHETAHGGSMGHGDEFVVQLADLYEQFAADGKLDEIRQRIHNTIAESVDLYSNLRSHYDRSSTKNIAQPLEGVQIPERVERDVAGSSNAGEGVEGSSGRQEFSGGPGRGQHGFIDARLAKALAIAGVGAVAGAILLPNDKITAGLVGGLLALGLGGAKIRNFRTVMGDNKLTRGVQRAITATSEQFIRNVNPDLLGPQAEATASVLGRVYTEMMQRQLGIEIPSSKRSEFWIRLGKEKSRRFLDMLERGATFTEPTMNAYAQAYRAWMDKIYKADKSYDVKYDPIDNYVYHAFEDPDAVAAFLNKKYGIKWGDPSFTKDRHYEFIKEAEAAGFKLRTENPESLMLMRQHASDLAHLKIQALRDLTEFGLARRIEKGKPATVDEATWRSPNGELYALPDQTNQVMHNAFNTKSLWADPGMLGQVFRGAAYAKNTIIPIQLFSLFHPLHVQLGMSFADPLVAMTKKVAAGKASFGDLTLMGLSKLALTDIVSTPMEGWKVLKAFRGETPLAQLSDADKRSIVLMQEGTFNPTMPIEYRNQHMRDFRAALLKGGIAGNLQMAWNLPFAIMEKFYTKPIFEQWIPAVKTAAFLRGAYAALEANPTLLNQPLERMNALRRISKMVDDRFGEVQYKTLFMNRAVKDVAVASLLSYGWQLGFVRSYMGAVPEAMQAGRNVMRGRESLTGEISKGNLDKSLFVGYYIMGTLLYGGLLTYALTGDRPREIMDYIFPRTGQVNADGSQTRVSTPFYTREFISIPKHLSEEGLIQGSASIVGSKLSPAIGMIKDIVMNKDFFNREISDPNSPYLNQLGQRLSHVFKSVTPIAIQGIEKGPPGAKTALLSATGFSPAPKYVTDTDMEQRIKHEYGKYHSSTVPYNQAQKSAAVGELYRLKQQGSEDKYQLKLQEIREKFNLNDNQVRLIERNAQIPTAERLFRQLPLNAQERLLKDMSPEEQERFRPYSNKKLRYQ